MVLPCRRKLGVNTRTVSSSGSAKSTEPVIDAFEEDISDFNTKKRSKTDEFE